MTIKEEKETCDRQKWSDVKRIIEDVFRDTDIEIVVCIK